jgi:hypothetical protein
MILGKGCDLPHPYFLAVFVASKFINITRAIYPEV